MSSETNPAIICCGAVLCTILFIYAMTMIESPNFPLFMGGSIVVAIIMLLLNYVSVGEKRKKAFEAQMKSRGLVKYKEKWGTSEQVFAWQQLEKGLVKYEDRWITPEEKEKIEEEIETKRRETERQRREKELFEAEQRRQGLVKFMDRFGQEHWDTSERIEILRQKDFEERQKAKGLILYQGKWITPTKKFEKEQLAKGLRKYVNRSGHVTWGTPQQVEKWHQKDFEEEQRAKGLVKYEGKWISKDEMELLKFKNEKTPEELATEIASYIRRNSIGTSINTRAFNELITRFWREKYRSVLFSRFWDRTIISKMKEAEAATFNKYLSLLTEELIGWAQGRNLMRLTRADVKLFLTSNNLKLSTSLEQMLYREAKLKYRWLPSWMRE